MVEGDTASDKDADADKSLTAGSAVVTFFFFFSNVIKCIPHQSRLQTSRQASSAAAITYASCRDFQEGGEEEEEEEGIEVEAELEDKDEKTSTKGKRSRGQKDTSKDQKDSSSDQKDTSKDQKDTSKDQKDTSKDKKVVSKKKATFASSKSAYATRKVVSRMSATSEVEAKREDSDDEENNLSQLKICILAIFYMKEMERLLEKSCYNEN